MTTFTDSDWAARKEARKSSSAGKAEGGVLDCVDSSLLHSCTFASLVTGPSRALDHSSNAFALAQVVPQNRVAFDTYCCSFVSASGSFRLVLYCSRRSTALSPHQISYPRFGILLSVSQGDLSFFCLGTSLHVSLVCFLTAFGLSSPITVSFGLLASVMSVELLCT